MFTILSELKYRINKDITDIENVWSENPDNQLYFAEISGLKRALEHIQRAEAQEYNALDEWASEIQKKGNQNGNDGNDSSFGDPALVTCEAGERGFVPGIPGTNNPGNDPSFANSGITEIASVGSGNKDNNATIQLSNNGLMGGFSGSGRASGGNIAGEQGQLIIFQNIGS